VLGFRKTTVIYGTWDVLISKVYASILSRIKI